MPLVLTVVDHWTDGTKIHVIGTVAATGNYPTGGDIVDMKSEKIKSSSAPQFTSFVGRAGYTYVFLPGSTRSNGKMKILTGAAAVSSPSAELSPGAYPAGITGDLIRFYGIFPQFI